jgi:hypothetical protein
MNAATQRLSSTNPSCFPRPKSGRGRRLPAAVLTLGLTLLLQSARSQPALVGQWLNGSANFADVSGYAPAGTHDGYIVGAGNYVFTNDVPPGKSGQSLFFYNGDTGLAISNSSTSGANYLDTFDNRVNSAMTVTFWAKGWPGNWDPFVSKHGEAGLGWQLRQFGQDAVNPCWTVRGAGGTVTLGVAGGFAGPEDLGATNFPLGNDTNNWHFYVGTFDAATGDRHMYIDGQRAASATGGVVYAMSPASFLCIGARDYGGNNFGNFSTLKIYDVRIFNFAPSIYRSPVAWRVVPGMDEGNLILTWPFGLLRQATNLAGPWTLTGATSPYTNSMTAPQMFFKVSMEVLAIY